MILDAVAIIILLFSAWRGRKIGLFRTVARFLSFALATLATIVWGDAVRLWVSETPLYAVTLEKVTAYVEGTLGKGETAILSPFLFGEAGATFAKSAAGNIVDTLVSVLCFVAFLLFVRLAITVIDKAIFRLPLLQPLNKGLGMVLSFAFTLAVFYLLVGGLGSLSAFEESGFLAGQMESSLLVRHMYENNWMLNLITRKG